MLTLKKKIILSAVSGILFAALTFFLCLPALSVFSVGFWFWLTFTLAFFAWPFFFPNGEVKVKRVNGKVAGVSFKNDTNHAKLCGILAACCVLPLVFCLLAALFSSAPIFHAKRYASVITVETADFATDMPETTEVSNIALMDTASATYIGNRTLGALSDVVSQYEISPTYTQINYKNNPRKVSPLEYSDFFKWMGNRSSGIPGFVMVDPVNSSAEYVKLDTPMHYAESAYFGEDLARKLRLSYPTKIFGSMAFEIDENGTPCYVVACMKPTVGLFGGMDVSEVILFNPCDGSSDIMPVEETPEWVDIVYTGYLASEKYNWQGTLSGGFFNSIIGQVGCKQTTDDFGYIVRDNDVWYFTGVTSITADESNIGFILTNARTGAYKYYAVEGAEEYSAMAAAQGEVQEKGYVASFPSLINLSGKATYIMVLKDEYGLVKLYALVNVENPSIVTTGTTQREAMTAYRNLLLSSGAVEEEAHETEITVENVRTVTMSDGATVYLTATDGKVYKGYLETDETLILIRVGDKLKLTYSDTNANGIYRISAWEFAE